jgi:hypothetical protein
MGYASSCWLKTTNIHTYPYIISIHIPETSTNSIKKLDDLNIGPIGLLNMTFRNRGIDTKDSGSHRSDAHTAAYHL